MVIENKTYSFLFKTGIDAPKYLDLLVDEFKMLLRKFERPARLRSVVKAMVNFVPVVITL